MSLQVIMRTPCLVSQYLMAGSIWLTFGMWLKTIRLPLRKTLSIILIDILFVVITHTFTKLKTNFDCALRNVGLLVLNNFRKFPGLVNLTSIRVRDKLGKLESHKARVIAK